MKTVDDASSTGVGKKTRSNGRSLGESKRDKEQFGHVKLDLVGNTQLRCSAG